MVCTSEGLVSFLNLRTRNPVVFRDIPISCARLGHTVHGGEGVVSDGDGGGGGAGDVGGAACAAGAARETERLAHIVGASLHSQCRTLAMCANETLVWSVHNLHPPDFSQVLRDKVLSILSPSRNTLQADENPAFATVAARH